LLLLLLLLLLGTTTTTTTTTTGPPSAKWQNFVTMLFFGIKIATTKHKIMLHAVSLNLPILLNAFTRNVCVSVTSLFDKLNQHIIDTAVRQWHTRLCACVKAKGAHFEHKLRQQFRMLLLLITAQST